jgi:hypothetical protein
MSDVRLGFAALLKHSIPELARRQAPIAKARRSGRALELDMGEGSREQGFRLNGSR